MKDINTVAILGAGAMGAFFAERFAGAPGFSTVLVARGERGKRLAQNGLVVNGNTWRIPVVHPDRAAAPADLIIVALKHHCLANALPDLKHLVGPETTIISVMNGLESEKTIGAVYGMDKLLYAVSVGIDALRAGNRVTYTTPGRHFFGEAENTAPSRRVQQVQAAFDRAGIPWETPSDMMRMLWWKFMVNVGINQASAVMRAPFGVFQSSPAARALMRDLMVEVIAVAGPAGVNLTKQDVDKWQAMIASLSPQGKTSMLQDIETGSKTEVEIFGGTVVALGKTHGIPTPVNQTVLRIIQVLERN